MPVTEKISRLFMKMNAMRLMAPEPEAAQAVAALADGRCCPRKGTFKPLRRNNESH